MSEPPISDRRPPVLASSLLLLNLLAWGGVAVVLVIVVPQQLERFADVGADLPLPTIMLINCGQLLASLWFVALPLALLAGGLALGAVLMDGQATWLLALLALALVVGLSLLTYCGLALQLPMAALEERLAALAAPAQIPLVAPLADDARSWSDAADGEPRHDLQHLRVTLRADVTEGQLEELQAALGATIVAGSAERVIELRVADPVAARPLAASQPGVASAELIHPAG